MVDETTVESTFVQDGLKDLESFSFQPDWAKNDSSDTNVRKRHDSGDNFKRNRRIGDSRNSSRSFSSGDRGSGRRRFPNRDQNGRYSKDRGHDSKKFDKREFRNDRPRFEPIVNVEFYPNDANFNELIEQLRLSCKTYELFAVARLFLGKPERFAMVVKKKDGCADKNLYLTTDDGFVFDTETEAIAHVLDAHIDKYFDVHEEEIQPPKGNFTILHKCGITGRVLCPPNYHEYQKVLLDHHEKYLPNVLFEKFKSKIVKTSEQSEIDAWKESVSKIAVYTPKECDSDQVELKTSSELRSFFVDHFKDRAISQFESVRVPGEVFAKMPKGIISKSLFVTIEREKLFPLNFANNLRGKFRRAHFTIYKIGGKPGISCVCGIKRKFRTVGDEMADNLQPIMSYLDSNKKCHITDLMRHFRKICGNGEKTSVKHENQDVYTENGVTPSVTESENKEEGSNNESVGEEHEAIGQIGDEKSDEANVETAQSDSSERSENNAVSISESNTNNSDVDSGKVCKSGSSQLTMDEVLSGLHWLIQEGYVAEFEDGTLLSTEFMPKPSNKCSVQDVAVNDEGADGNSSDDSALQKEDENVDGVTQSGTESLASESEENKSES